MQTKYNKINPFMSGHTHTTESNGSWWWWCYSCRRYGTLNYEDATNVEQQRRLRSKQSWQNDVHILWEIKSKISDPHSTPLFLKQYLHAH